MAKSVANRNAKRERLWVPGMAYLAEDRSLRVGSEVGYSGSGEDWRLAGFPAIPLSELRHRLWLVARAQLEDEIIDEYALILPERLVDAEAQPRARAWLEAQPLVCVSGSKWQRLVERGLRIHCVEHGVEAPGQVRVQAAGAERAGWSLRLQLAELQRVADLDPEQLESASLARLEAVGPLIDRLLRVVSRDVLSEAAVVNAYLARRLVEPGYGYQGAPNGTAASIEQVQRGLRGLESLFEQVESRAEGMRSDARSVARALRGIPDDVESVQVPLYSLARQRVRAAITLPLKDDPADGPSWLVDGEPRHELVLPEQRSWLVERVGMWEPKLPAALRSELAVPPKQSDARPLWWLMPALIGALLVLIVVAMIMQR